LSFALSKEVSVNNKKKQGITLLKPKKTFMKHADYVYGGSIQKYKDNKKN